MPNVYSQPEKFGLETVGEVDWGTSSGYGHNVTVVFRDLVTNRLYIASDEGCSCDLAFQDVGLDSDKFILIDRTQVAIDVLLNTKRAIQRDSHGQEQAAELVLKVKELFNAAARGPVSEAAPTQEEAAHVLYYMDRPGGWPPGVWTDSLISVMDRADYVNTHKFALAFPGYSAALSLFKNDPDGVAKLQLIATSPSKDSKK